MNEREDYSGEAIPATEPSSVTVKTFRVEDALASGVSCLGL